MQKYTLFGTRFWAMYACFMLGFLMTVAAQTVEPFEHGNLSNGDAFGLTLSPDGKTAVFVKSYGGRDSLHLFTSTWENGQWTKPQLAPFSTFGKRWKDIDPAFSPDGKLLLFNSTRTVAGNQAKPDFDIWAVPRTGITWGKPYHLGTVMNTDSSDIYATMSHSGNIYFSSDRAAGKGKLDIYVSVFRNGTYQTPQNLGSLINGVNHDSNPYISPKEDYLIYWRQEPDGYGASDLYISFNQKGTWSKPLNLGPKINTKNGEFCPFVKGKKLYFSRSEVKEGKRREDLYSVDFSVNEWKRKLD